MDEHEPERSTVDALGIRPPCAYAIEARTTPAGERRADARGRARPRRRAGRARAPRGGRGRRRARIVLDMAEVTFVDSSALRELLRADGAAARGRAACSCSPRCPPAVARLLELTRTDDVLTSAPSRRATRSSGPEAASRALRLLGARLAAAFARAHSSEKAVCSASLPADAASTAVTVRPAGGGVQRAARRARARSRRPCSACSRAARRRRSAGAGRAGGAALGALLDERLAQPRLDLLVHDQLRERERRRRERDELGARDRLAAAGGVREAGEQRAVDAPRAPRSPPPRSGSARRASRASDRQRVGIRRQRVRPGRRRRRHGVRAGTGAGSGPGIGGSGCGVITQWTTRATRAPKRDRGARWAPRS